MTERGPELPDPAPPAPAPTGVQHLRRLFDTVAPEYDNVGVEFFQPIALGLLAELAPGPGERVADLGCGTGAFLLPAARSVGPSGSIVGLDISAAMLERARSAAAAEGLDHVALVPGDAADPDLPAAAFEVLAASAVLFFLADPSSALARWRALLVPGGRIGVSTFGPQDGVWQSVDEVFTPYLPADMLDARTSGRRGPFASDAGMEQLVGDAGFDQVRTATREVPVRFRDAEHWQAFTMTTGQRAMWGFVPEAERAAVRDEARRRLADAAHPEGGYVVHQQVRYTLAARPA